MNHGVEGENGKRLSTVVNPSVGALPQARAMNGVYSPRGHRPPAAPNQGQPSKTSVKPPFETELSQSKSPDMESSTREGSPRSVQSDSSHTTHALRRTRKNCKYETGMAQAKRRVPYSLGSDKLDSEHVELKQTLAGEKELRITADMQQLYHQLLPSVESEQRRAQFLRNMEALLVTRWPGSHISVSVFGSSGNRLGTTDSDVDICITTDHKEIENVCLIAELLAERGFERIVCVSSAKVPIVKAWDPVLQVACDINVNNPIALKNTEMMRHYIEIDDRLRPLAMIVKYWAKRRMLNDAGRPSLCPVDSCLSTDRALALGGTLSSYTWICMVLNFLQTRKPPILPTLQQQPGLSPEILNGVDVAFDRNLKTYRAFGAQNESTLGDLLFQFFQYFAHTFDFEGCALSVRLGKVIPKSEKGWQFLQNNRLCVEEPFNVGRNLANTADDTSMRGIHLELRRAYQSICEGDLAQCCEEFVPGPDEHKPKEAFVHQTARRLIPQAPAQPTPQGSGRNRSYRNPKHGNRSTAARRASNPAARNPNYLHDLPFQMTPQELQLQAQHQQHLLHDQLFQQYQYLQAQEQELRLQLYQQNLRQRGLLASQTVPQPAYPSEPSSAARAPLSPTMLQAKYGNLSPYSTSTTLSPGVMTNPTSPMLGNAIPDSRRYARRTSSAATPPPGSLRAQSQPARPIPGSHNFVSARYGSGVYVHGGDPFSRRTSFASAPYGPFPYGVYNGPASSLYEAGRRPAEFMGYYVGQSPSITPGSQSATISPIPSHAGLNIQHGGLSPQIPSRGSIQPSGASTPSLRESGTLAEPPVVPLERTGPLIVDGSVKSPKRKAPRERNVGNVSDTFTMSTSTSDDVDVETPSTTEGFTNGLSDHVAVAGQESYASPLTMNGLMDDVYNLNLKLHSKYDELSLQNTHSQKTLPDGSLEARSDPHGRLGSAALNVPGQSPNPPVVPDTSHEQTPISNKTLEAVGNGWQTQKKKKNKRKANRSEGDAARVNSAGGELLPLDENLRKGG